MREVNASAQRTQQRRACCDAVRRGMPKRPAKYARQCDNETLREKVEKLVGCKGSVPAYRWECDHLCQQNAEQQSTRAEARSIAINREARAALFEVPIVTAWQIC